MGGPMKRSSLHCALRRIGLGRQLVQRSEERWRLTEKQSHVGQELHRSMRGAARFGRPDDRDSREFAIEEDCGLGHDEVRLKIFTAERWLVEVREAQAGRWVGDRRCV